MQKNYKIKQSVRFRCWSRKRYAMFLSLGRQVTIGYLAKDIVEVALKKQKGVVSQSCCVQPERECREEEERTGERPASFLLLSAVLQPQVAADTSCGVSDEIEIINSYVPGWHTDGVVLQPICVPSFFRASVHKGKRIC